MSFSRPESGLMGRRTNRNLQVARPAGTAGSEGHYFRRVGPGTVSSIKPPAIPTVSLPGPLEGLAALTSLSGTVDTLDDLGGAGAVKVLLDQEETAMGAARAYLRSIEQSTASRLRSKVKEITTLVPVSASPYRDYMFQGERAFRANNFLTAYTDFQIASDMGDRGPESLIELTHTQFALSRYSYAKASYFLQEALKVMPELPTVVGLRPRKFYGSETKYAEHLVSLQEHIEKHSSDGEAQLLLAYFRWFEDPGGEDPAARKAARQALVAAARQALARGLASAVEANNTHLVEAVETFWDGMVAVGEVSGKLKPAPRPAAGEPAKATPVRAAKRAS